MDLSFFKPSQVFSGDKILIVLGGKNETPTWGKNETPQIPYISMYMSALVHFLS